MSDSTNRSDSQVNELSALLPRFYQDALADDEHSSANELIAILHHAIADLADAIALNHKPVMRYMSSGDTGINNYQAPNLLSEIDRTLLTSTQFAAIEDVFAQADRSWLGAIRIVEILFPGKKVRLEEGRVVQRFLPSQNMTGLEGKNALGANSVLGHKLEDRMNRCRFYVAVLNNDELNLQGTDQYVGLVARLLKQFVQQSLEIELVLVLATQTQKNTPLGAEQQAVLGVKTWLSAASGQEKELVFKL